MGAQRRERPPVEVHHRYKWTYLYSFVRPATGEVHWLILPPRGKHRSVLTHGVNTEVFSMALSHFAEQVGAGSKDKRILLVLDQAGWHTTSPRVEVPEGIELEFLPSNSPELQPSERLWPLTNEGVSNRYYFEEIGSLLEGALIERCVALCGQPEIIRSYTALPLVAGGSMRTLCYSTVNGMTFLVEQASPSVALGVFAAITKRNLKRAQNIEWERERRLLLEAYARRCKKRRNRENCYDACARQPLSLNTCDRRAEDGYPALSLGKVSRNTGPPPFAFSAFRLPCWARA